MPGGFAEGFRFRRSFALIIRCSYLSFTYLLSTVANGEFLLAKRYERLVRCYRKGNGLYLSQP